jgi:penicillin G amidase
MLNFDFRRSEASPSWHLCARIPTGYPCFPLEPVCGPFFWNMHMISPETELEPSVCQATESEQRRRPWRAITFGGLMVCLVGTSGAGGLATWTFRSSLPRLDGTVRSTELQNNVTIDRDAQGVPTVCGLSRTDTAYGLGFVHAQDRFFQMDILRRNSGGRLCELVGKAALGRDKSFRKHRFQSLAEKVLADLPSRQRDVLEAYAKGVNHGLRDLKALPFEYLVLGVEPKPWVASDSILCMMSMLCDLQPMDAGPELGLGYLKERVPADVYEFLVRPTSQWDAALDGSMYPPVSIPSESSFSLREITRAARQKEPSNAPAASAQASMQIHDYEFRVGSNNWAVGAKVGRDGKAILASDMHLGLQVPTIWYRAMMKTPSIDGTVRRLIGVTLPGAPVMVEGSNGSVAWGFTNSTGDFGDVIELKSPDGGKVTDRYLTPNGPKEIERITEEIVFPTGSETYEYLWTVWGPVVETRDDKMFVHKWIGHDPGAFDMNLMEFESAQNVEQLMELASRAGMPNQNAMIVDDQGNIGWTISGRIPKRVVPPPNTPVDWSQGGEWLGYLAPSEHPRAYNPPDGRLWTANNRIQGDYFLSVIGDGRYDLGARARQIRDRLYDKEMHDEQSLLDIQLDDEAKFLRPWKDRLLAIADLSPQPVSNELVRFVKTSSDRASADAVGYRIVHEFRSQVIARIFGTASSRRDTQRPAGAGGLACLLPDKPYVAMSFEDVAQQLLTDRPMHWLPAEYATWDALLADAAKGTEETLTKNQPLSEARWGVRNRAAIRHPLAMAVPALSGVLNMTDYELPGDNHMPRVQSPSGGASERLVVSPGQEESGIYQQPGGQSGHPFSPFFTKGYEDWVFGHPSPLLPGKSQHQIVLLANKPSGN